MSQVDFRKTCLKLTKQLSKAFIERIERRLGQNFDEALEEKPRELLISVLRDIQLYYVGPFEYVLDMSKYLKERYDISQFFLSLSKNYDYPVSERIEEASRIVGTFYEMVRSLGFQELFMMGSRGKWWKDEF